MGTWTAFFILQDKNNMFCFFYATLFFFQHRSVFCELALLLMNRLPISDGSQHQQGTKVDQVILILYKNNYVQ